MGAPQCLARCNWPRRMHDSIGPSRKSRRMTEMVPRSCLHLRSCQRPARHRSGGRTILHLQPWGARDSASAWAPPLAEQLLMAQTLIAHRRPGPALWAPHVGVAVAEMARKWALSVSGCYLECCWSSECKCLHLLLAMGTEIRSNTRLPLTGPAGKHLPITTARTARPKPQPHRGQKALSNLVPLGFPFSVHPRPPSAIVQLSTNVQTPPPRPRTLPKAHLDVHQHFLSNPPGHQIAKGDQTLPQILHSTSLSPCRCQPSGSRRPCLKRVSWDR